MYTQKGSESPVMNKAIKYRIYPTTEQKILFAKTFGCCRKVYNLMLSDKISSYQVSKSFGKQTPAMYKDEFPYLKEVDSLALTNVQIHLQTAMKNHFDKKRKKRTGFPKFKFAKRSRRSYTTNNQNGTVALVQNGLRLPKTGIVKAVIHRYPEKDWIIKSATVSQDSTGNYYASVLFEFEKEIIPVPVSDNVIGLDYASDGLYKDNYCNTGSDHKFFLESQKKLRREQRRLSRMTGSKKDEPKSNNYMKQQLKVNKIYRHAANQRLDHLHKLSTGIANRYDVVCVESLNMRAMANKGFGNGKATLDNGYGMFLSMLEYKLADRNKYFVKVDKWFPSSQICHCCGFLHPEMKDLRIRTMKCDCGLTMGRDRNAAINILQEGLRTLTAAA